MTAVSNDTAPAVGVSISESPDMGALGLSAGHVRDATAMVAQEVLSSGCSLAYGGDLRPGDFTELLDNLLVRYRGHPDHGSTIAVTNYLAWPTHIRMAPDELAALRAALEPVMDLVLLSRDGAGISREERLELHAHEPDRDEWASGLTAMRTAMRRNICARVVLGGAVDGYMGALPDIAEEASLSLEARQPIFLIGGFGGCTRDIAETIGLVERWGGSRNDWTGRERFRRYSPDDLHNGLSLDENKLLARTPHALEAVALVMRGLRRIVDRGRTRETRPVRPKGTNEQEGGTSRFRLRSMRLRNYRCFEDLELAIEEDATVLFAENGGGKTALLSALALGLAVFQPGTPRTFELDARRDPRMRTLDEAGRRERVGDCGIVWTADVGERESVNWDTTMPVIGRVDHWHIPIFDAMGRVRAPGQRWPLFAWYGVDRLRRGDGEPRRVERQHDRWEGYAGALDPSLDEAALLQWLQDEMLGDAVRRQQHEPERLFHDAVMAAVARATPDVAHAWYDPATKAPMVRFENGHAAPWSELSDGYHAFIALVADIARRAVILNEFDGAEAPAWVQGVVLIDELDLHLHPRWQRVALAGLRSAFPRLQFVVTTHSPQVLSSVENRQGRWLADGRLQDAPVLVEGRDTNAILREHMHTDDRDEEGVRELRLLHDAIDRGDYEEATRRHQELVRRWGNDDPALIRASWFMEE